MKIQFPNNKKVNPKQLAQELGLTKYRVLVEPHTKTIILPGGTESVEFYGYEIEFETNGLTESEILQKRQLAEQHMPEKTEIEERQQKIQDEELLEFKNKFMKLLLDDNVKQEIKKVK